MICTKGKRAPDFCEVISWDGPQAAQYAYRRFRVACQFGVVFPSEKAGKRKKQKRRFLRGGTVELLKVVDSVHGKYKRLKVCTKGG